MYKFHRNLNGVDFYAPSTRKNKKYDAYVDGKKISFGDTRYQQYQDLIGYYSHLDHYDINRMKAYHARHKHGTDPSNKTAAYFSKMFLW